MTSLSLHIEIGAGRMRRAMRQARDRAFGPESGNLFSGNGWIIVGVASVILTVLVGAAVWPHATGQEPIPEGGVWLTLCLLSLPVACWLALRFLLDLLRYAGSGFLTRERTGILMEGLHYGRFRVQLDDEGLSQETEHYAERIAWNAISGAFMDRGWICLVSGAQLMALLPRTSEVETFLAAKGLHPE